MMRGFLYIQIKNVMERIVDVIRSYNDYSYDDILDAYSIYKSKDLLDYCYIKYNKMDIPLIMHHYGKTYEDAFLFVFNIQRKIEGDCIVDNFNDMYNLIVDMLYLDDIDNPSEYFDF